MARIAPSRVVVGARTRPAVLDGVIVLSIGLGVLLVGVADAISRRGEPASLALYWLGMLALFGPVTARLLMPRSAGAGANSAPLRGGRRLGLVVLLAIALYAVKVMVSPLGLTLPDEFSHLRTLLDILGTGHFFAPNPLLPISSVYPGLEAGSAVASVSTGLGAFPIALLIVGLARVTTLAAIFLLALRVTGSSRAAGVACIVYSANPSFLTFDAAYAYESLALPLALVAVWATLRWTERPGRSAPDALVAVLAIAAVSVTHHLTSIVLLGFLVAWAAIAMVRERAIAPARPILVSAIVAIACDLAWLGIAGTIALQYLGTIVGGGFQELVGIILGAGEAKHLFASHAGFVSPPIEVVAAYAAVGLLCLALPVVLWHAVRSRPPKPFVLALALLALLYPASLALRFTVAGSETSQRASEFVFVALGILGADWLVGHRRARFRLPLPAAWAAILVVVAGGIIAGEPPVGRLPGPYHVAAEQRSFEPEGYAASDWVLQELGPANRLVADRTNAKLLGSLGRQYPVTAADSHLGTAWVMYDLTLSSADLSVLRRAGIRYVVVDLRLARDVPAYAYVFEQDEPDGGNHTTPMPLASLQKWDAEPGVTRIYDSGDIVIYDLRGLVDAGA